MVSMNHQHMNMHINCVMYNSDHIILCKQEVNNIINNNRVDMLQ